MHFGRLQEMYKIKRYPILQIKSGMFLELHEDVGEGDVKRIQKFKGLVIQVKKPSHPNGTFTIRGTIAGVIVEKIFPLSFPKFEKVILLDQFQTRRARINYIRDKVGKDAKMKSIITVDIKEKDLLAEAYAALGPETTSASDEVQDTQTATPETIADTNIQETIQTEETPKQQEETIQEEVPTQTDEEKKAE